jgi:hypothetical protein
MAAGISRPTRAQCIQYGLIAAAELNPLDVPSDQVTGLVRAALFDLSDTPAVDATTRDAVLARLLRALDRHLDDGTTQFRCWFLEPNNSVVLQLAKQKGEEGVPIEKASVRRAMLDIGWEAYYHVRNCLVGQMHAFCHAMQPQLTDAERTLLGRMHLPQPYFGDLPLVLLAERLDLIGPLLWRLWNSPDETAVRILHRLLTYYADMASVRRRADRRFKERTRKPASDEAPMRDHQPDESVSLSGAGSRIMTFSLDEHRDSPTTPETAIGIIQHICESRHIQCQCLAPDWSLLDASMETDGFTTVRGACRQCQRSWEARLSPEETAEIQKLFQH